eukprot:1151633-Pelagomonas_calceolata.AAC.3
MWRNLGGDNKARIWCASKMVSCLKDGVLCTAIRERTMLPDRVQAPFCSSKAAHEGSLAEPKTVPTTKPDQAGDKNESYQSQHFRHADKNLSNPRTLAWLKKSFRRDTLFGH